MWGPSLLFSLTSNQLQKRYGLFNSFVICLNTLLLYALSAMSFQDYAQLGSKILFFHLNQTYFKLVYNYNGLQYAQSGGISLLRNVTTCQSTWIHNPGDFYLHIQIAFPNRNEKVINWITRFHTLLDLKGHHYSVKRTPHTFSYRSKNVCPTHVCLHVKDQL